MGGCEGGGFLAFVRKAGELSTMEVQIICVYCVIESLAIHLLDVQPPDFSPTDEYFESLRLHLLSEGRIEDLEMIHINQSQIRHRTFRISSLEDTLEAIGPDDLEMQVHFHVILASAFKRDGNIESACQQLEQVQRDPLSGINHERQLFALYLQVSLYNHPVDPSEDQVSRLLGDLTVIGNYHACELLECWLSEVELLKSSNNDYIQSVKRLLDKRSVL